MLRTDGKTRKLSIVITAVRKFELSLKYFEFVTVVICLEQSQIFLQFFFLLLITSFCLAYHVLCISCLCYRLHLRSANNKNKSSKQKIPHFKK